MSAGYMMRLGHKHDLSGLDLSSTPSQSDHQTFIKKTVITPVSPTSIECTRHYCDGNIILVLKHGGVNIQIIHIIIIIIIIV